MCGNGSWPAGLLCGFILILGLSGEPVENREDMQLVTLQMEKVSQKRMATSPSNTEYESTYAVKVRE